MKEDRIIRILIAIALLLLASLPSLMFIVACKKPKIKDPNNYCACGGREELDFNNASYSKEKSKRNYENL
jgi:hypothetical protein